MLKECLCVTPEATFVHSLESLSGNFVIRALYDLTCSSMIESQRSEMFWLQWCSFRAGAEQQYKAAIRVTNIVPLHFIPPCRHIATVDMGQKMMNGSCKYSHRTETTISRHGQHFPSNVQSTRNWSNCQISPHNREMSSSLEIAPTGAWATFYIKIGINHHWLSTEGCFR